MRLRKYNNIPTVVDGYRLDSKAEAKRYAELKLLEKAKHITDLKVHPIFPMEVNGQKVCTYEADFSYRDKIGELRIEDVKGVKTALFNLKKKLLWATHRINVEVVNVKRGTFRGVNIDRVHKESQKQR